MTKHQRTLDQLLQGVVTALFPGGNAPQVLAVGMADSEGDTPLHVCETAECRRKAMRLTAERPNDWLAGS